MFHCTVFWDFRFDLLCLPYILCFAFRLLPTVHALGKSSNISALFMVRWRSRRVGTFGRSSPFRGRPRLRFTGSGAFFFGTGFSLASIAVESREIWPTNESA